MISRWAAQGNHKLMLRWNSRNADAYHLYNGDLPQFVLGLFVPCEGVHLLLQTLVELAQPTNLTPQLAEGCSTALCFVDYIMCYDHHRVALRCHTLQLLRSQHAKPHLWFKSDKHLASAGCPQKRWWCGVSSFHQQLAGCMPRSWCTRTCRPITS